MCKYLQVHSSEDHETSFCVETLLDALVVLYEECCNSSFKKEKTVSEFVESGMQCEVVSYYGTCNSTPC